MAEASAGALLFLQGLSAEKLQMHWDSEKNTPEMLVAEAEISFLERIHTQLTKQIQY